MQLQTAEERRERQRDEARRVILEATESLMLEAPDQDFSIRKLAERCGFAPPTIYHYFRDKDALIDALIEDRFRDLADRTEAAVQRAQDPEEELLAFARAFLAFGLENPTHYGLLLRVARDGRSRDAPAVEAARQLLRRPLHQLASAGRLYTPDIEAAAQTAFALLHGLTTFQITNFQLKISPDLSAVALDAMVRGLVRPEARERRPSGMGRAQ